MTRPLVGEFLSHLRQRLSVAVYIIFITGL
jgi:hypothetical protein